MDIFKRLYLKITFKIFRFKNRKRLKEIEKLEKELGYKEDGE